MDKRNVLKAIATLEQAFKDNPEFKRAWRDYMEIRMIEAFEKHAPAFDIPTMQKLLKDASSGIVRLFDKIWWEELGMKDFPGDNELKQDKSRITNG